MKNQLLERYQNRLARADRASVKRTGSRLDEGKAFFMAQILRNVSDYIDGRGRLNEALDNSIGTQTKDVGTFKKFILDITEVSLPNLIN